MFYLKSPIRVNTMWSLFSSISVAGCKSSSLGKAVSCLIKCRPFGGIGDGTWGPRPAPLPSFMLCFVCSEPGSSPFSLC